jgi:hypothetical protein
MKETPPVPTPLTPPGAAPKTDPPEHVSHLDRLPACPVCGGELEDIRQKWQCRRCHTICETCCEGGRG